MTAAPATLTLTFRAITPIFMGGAIPAHCWELLRQGGPGARPQRGAQIDMGLAELRPSSLKGLLRFWYRAIDPDYARHEPVVFGGAGSGQGQGPFSMTAAPPVTGSWPWRGNDYDRFTQPAANVWKNGATYLGFPLETRDTRQGFQSQRVALPLGAGVDYTVTHHLSRRAMDDERVLKGLYSSWWLLCHLGGLGARCRRGFGSVALTSWQLAGAQGPEGSPPLPYSRSSATLEEWWKDFSEGLDALRRWYRVTAPPVGLPDHLVLDHSSRFILAPVPSPRTGRAGTWQDGLDAVGRLMQDFRQKKLDYRLTKAYLDLRFGTGGAPLRAAPERGAFGLPLPFSSQSLGHWARAVFQGETHDRSASRIWLRVVHVGGAFWPLVIRLAGPLLPETERIKDAEWVDRDRKPVETWAQPGDGVLDQFCDEVASVPGALPRTGV